MEKIGWIKRFIVKRGKERRRKKGGRGKVIRKGLKWLYKGKVKGSKSNKRRRTNVIKY